MALSVVVIVGVVVHQVFLDARARRRAREYEASRARAIQVRRDEDDLQWAGIESEWHSFLDRIPVMPFDPERLT